MTDTTWPKRISDDVDWDRIYRAEVDVPLDAGCDETFWGLNEPDMVNEPPHYLFENGVEVIDLTEQLNFNCGNAVKYICRAGRKDPERVVEDLRKAAFYVAREIARIERRASV